MQRAEFVSRTMVALTMTVALVVGSACSTNGTSAAPSSTTAAASSSAPAPTTSTRPEVEGSPGCGQAPDPGPAAGDTVDVEQTIDSDQVGRTYRLGVPTDYDPDEPAPLIFNFHGLGSNASQQSVYSAVPKAAQGKGILVVTPDALSGSWRVTGPDGAEAPDIVFVTDLLDNINSRYCIDQSRIYATGMSFGGLMSAAVACGIPDTFAAIGMVTFDYKPATCEPVPALAFHGTADNVVRYGELDAPGPNGTLKNLEDWATLDGCEVEPELAKIGTDIEHRVYPGCDGGAEVELYTVIDGGHTWPGSAIKIGATTDTIDATELILDFFAEHPKVS